MIGNTARVTLACLALCWCVLADAAQVAVPPLAARVTDQTATLTDAQKTALEQKLQAFETSKGSQLAVLIVPTTGDEQIEQYSLRVVEQWKLGRKKVDDGALLIVAKDDRKLRIEVGYGLEGALNDAISKRIISEIIVPRFKQADFYGGIDAGIDQMIRIVNGEPLPEPTSHSSGGAQGTGQSAPIILFLIIMFGGTFLRSVVGRLPAAFVVGGVTALMAWFLVGSLFFALGAALFAFVVTVGGGSTGRHGGWCSGGGGWSGGGGGGFSGGGGGFGGGGASGSW